MKTISEIIEQEEVTRRNTLLSIDSSFYQRAFEQASHVDKLKFLTVTLGLNLAEVKRFLYHFEKENKSFYDAYCLTINDK